MTPENRREVVLGIILCLVLGALAPWIWKQKQVAPRIADCQAQLKAEERLATALDVAPAPGQEELEDLRRRREALKRLLPAPPRLPAGVATSPEQALAGLLEKLRGDGIIIQGFATDERIRTKLKITCDYQSLVLLLRDFPAAAPGLAVIGLEIEGKAGPLNCGLQLAPINLQPEKK